MISRALVMILGALWPFLAWVLVEAWLLAYVPSQYRDAASVLSPVVLVAVAWVIAVGDPARRVPLLIGALLCLWQSAGFLWQWVTWLNWALANNAPWVDILHQFQSLHLLLTLVTFSVGLASLFHAFPGLLAFLRGAGGVLKTRRAKSDFYGAADWLKPSALRRLSSKGGVTLGQVQQSKPWQRGPQLVRYPLEAHAITIAPTRSGKGVSVINTNLLAADSGSWPGPVVLIDPKAEGYFICSRRRRQLGRRVALLDPFGVVKRKATERPELDITGTDSWHYNPLDFIRAGEQGVQDIGVILDALVPPPKEGAPENAAHFSRSARRIIGGFIAWVKATEPPAAQNLGRVRELVAQPKEVIDALLWRMSNNPDIGFGLPKDAADLLLGVEARERGSYYSTVTNALDWLKFPELREHVSRSDFDLTKLCDDELDVFVVVPPELMGDTRLWLRLWATLPLSVVARKTPKKRILLFLDEAPLIGRLDPVVDAFRVTAGLGLSVWLFSQTTHDLEREYGRETVAGMLGNCEVVQFFEVAPADNETANRLSEMLGEGTFEEESESENEGTSARVGDVFGNRSRSGGKTRRLVKRRLMTPDQIRAMKSDEVVILTRSKTDKGPIHGWQARYFERPECAGLFDPNPYR